MPLRKYLKKIQLPNIRITSQGQIGRAFLEKDITTLWAAIEYISKLPYGRTTSRENYLQVLEENKGTCSVKHALIAALAEELNLPLKLVLGIFLLNSTNMPKAAHILKYYKLEAIPEAHCYLKYNQHILDITFSDALEFIFTAELEEEVVITPQQIGSFKIQKHQAFIKSWAQNTTGLHFDFIWVVRERLIQELEHGNLE